MAGMMMMPGMQLNGRVILRSVIRMMVQIHRKIPNSKSYSTTTTFTL